MSAEVDMGTNAITNMADPSSAQDAATKAYVDAASTSSGSDLSTETAARIAGDAANSAEVTAAISTAAADATSKADAAQADAEATASADATSKANTAKSEAISTASADATSKANAAIATASADATSKANAAETAAKAHADQVVAATVDAAPAALDTLNELAAALGDDANFASTVTASIATKADDAATTAALATKEDKTTVAELDTFVKGEIFGEGEVVGPDVGLSNLSVSDVTITNGSTVESHADGVKIASTQQGLAVIPVTLEVGKTYAISTTTSEYLLTNHHSGNDVKAATASFFIMPSSVRPNGGHIWTDKQYSEIFMADNSSGRVLLENVNSGTASMTDNVGLVKSALPYRFITPSVADLHICILAQGEGTIFNSIHIEEYAFGTPGPETLDTSASQVIPAINELHTEINTLSSTQSSDQSSLQAQINSEVIRATAAEAANAANIVSETSARTSADNALESDIISLQNQVGTIIQGSPASLDTLVEIVSAFETADASLSGVITANGTRLTTAENNITALQTDLDAEETARGAGDASLQSQINALTGTTDSDTSSLQSQLTAEVARATAAEVVNASAISTETSRATAAESGLSSDISTETAARIAADDAETSARTTADAALQSAIDAEVARATGAESGLQSAIDFVKQNTDPAALDSLTEIVAAFQNADSNISGVVSSNTTRIGALESGLTVVEGYTTDNISEGSVNKYWTEQRTKDCLTGGLCISYNSSTGEIAIDEAEVATSLKTAESFASDDADKLDGQQGTYYRINVYDVNGSLVN